MAYGRRPMKKHDLRAEIPHSITLLEERGDPVTVHAVLETLGVELPPKLDSIDPAATPTEAGPGATSDAGRLLSLGRFQLVGEIGRGGMGRVLEARDPEIRRSVAVKVVIDPSSVGAAQLARFVAEAQITGQLEHPNIVPVYDMGLSRDGQFYFVMKKVEGRSLREVLDLLRLGDEETVAEWGRHRLLTAFTQVCNAVAYAHDRSVLHRDLKPDNIMLGPFGEVLLMDWGVARLMGDTTEIVSGEAIERVTVARTMDGAAIGTPGYMSPEQALGNLHELEARSDVWSLGTILYELLTLRPAYEASNVFVLMHRAMSGPPEDPRERAPELRIPEEIAAVALTALAPERDDRFASAAELAAAVQTFLEGSKRREAATRHVVEAEAAWERYRALDEEREVLLQRERELDEELEPWASLEEKAELLAVRDQLLDIAPDRVKRFSEVLTFSDKALSQDPGNSEARTLLARVHYARFEEAEVERDEEARLFHEGRVKEYDDGRHTALLQGTGALTLLTDPLGAEVICERFEQRGLVWPLVERRVLGTTPLEHVPLEQGSYLLTIRAAGKRDTRYPVFITRGRHWDSGDEPIPLYTDAQIGEGFVYVPAGPFVSGGDPQAQEALPRGEPWADGFFLSVLPVTMGEYCEFINGVAEDDPEEAWGRSPRQESGLKESGGQYWDRPAAGERYKVPEVDRDGDRWDPLWAVMGITWNDAVAYTTWRSTRDGAQYTLPPEQLWEKAARGVDGRLLVWGDGFDPTLCKMRESRPGRPQPEPMGTFASDVSVYGVRDLAGGSRDWCGDASYGGDPKRRPVRGGSWGANPRYCRAASRGAGEPWNVSSHDGLRLLRVAPFSPPRTSS